MTKVVMMSIQPKWIEKIFNGEKTIEVRKTAPKLETPFKVYIYCTKGGKKDIIVPMRNKKFTGDILNGKVVAEFTCDKIEHYETVTNQYHKGIYHMREDAENSVVQDIRLDMELEEIIVEYDFYKDSCLNGIDILNYQSNGNVFAWHISDLKIYDKPRELGEFGNCKHWRDKDKPRCYPDNCNQCIWSILTRPPQSWCYVEEI